MKQYQEIVKEVLINGVKKGDRTGTGTISTFNTNKSFNLKNGFPLVTGKFTPFNLVAAELLWFLSGSTNNNYLRVLNGSLKPTIWEKWADEDGELGPIYGKQWRDFGGVDQIQKIIDILKINPDSRRMVVSAWNPAEADDMALEPCHYAFEFYTKLASIDWRVAWAKEHSIEIKYTPNSPVVTVNRYLDELGIPSRMLSCKSIQRSCDVFLGVPFNIASYALLTHLIAHCVNMIPDTLHWSGGDTHIYNNHVLQVHEYLRRDIFVSPTLKINSNCPTEINDITMDHFSLLGYNCNPVIKAKVSV